MTQLLIYHLEFTAFYGHNHPLLHLLLTLVKNPKPLVAYIKFTLDTLNFPFVYLVLVYTLNIKGILIEIEVMKG